MNFYEMDHLIQEAQQQGAAMQGVGQAFGSTLRSAGGLAMKGVQRLGNFFGKNIAGYAKGLTQGLTGQKPGQPQAVGGNQAAITALTQLKQAAAQIQDPTQKAAIEKAVTDAEAALAKSSAAPAPGASTTAAS